MDKNLAKFLDAMNKIGAKNAMPDGGNQYTMEVALGPKASATNQARMRNQKVTPIKPMSIAELIRKAK